MNTRLVSVSAAATALLALTALYIYRDHRDYGATRQVTSHVAAGEGPQMIASIEAAARAATAKVELAVVPRAVEASPAVYGARVSNLPAYRAFADRAGLSESERAAIAGIVQLYYDNTTSLEQTMSGDQLTLMQKQLLSDTAGHLHVRIPHDSWKDFVSLGLIGGLADVVRSESDLARSGAAAR